jgi:hypothetical protein
LDCINLSHSRWVILLGGVASLNPTFAKATLIWTARWLSKRKAAFIQKAALRD